MKNQNAILKLALLTGGIVAVAGCVERRVVYVHDAPPPPPPAYSGQAPYSSAPVTSGAPPAAEPDSNVVATQAPPAPQVETVTVSPGPNYFWVPGYWGWQGGAYIWIGGGWRLRPWHGAVWAGGHWGRRGRGWVWVRGGWR